MPEIESHVTPSCRLHCRKSDHLYGPSSVSFKSICFLLVFSSTFLQIRDCVKRALRSPSSASKNPACCVSSSSALAADDAASRMLFSDLLMLRSRCYNNSCRVASAVNAHSASRTCCLIFCPSRPLHPAPARARTLAILLHFALQYTLQYCYTSSQLQLVTYLATFLPKADFCAAEAESRC